MKLRANKFPHCLSHFGVSLAVLVIAFQFGGTAICTQFAAAIPVPVGTQTSPMLGGAGSPTPGWVKKRTNTIEERQQKKRTASGGAKEQKQATGRAGAGTKGVSDKNKVPTPNTETKRPNTETRGPKTQTKGPNTETKGTGEEVNVSSGVN